MNNVLEVSNSGDISDFLDNLRDIDFVEMDCSEPITIETISGMIDDIFSSDKEGYTFDCRPMIEMQLASEQTDKETVAPQHSILDDASQWWKANPNTNIQLLSIEERKAVGRYKNKK